MSRRVCELERVSGSERERVRVRERVGGGVRAVLRESDSGM